MSNTGYIISIDEDPEPYEDFEYPVAVFICKDSADRFVSKLQLAHPVAFITIKDVPLRGDLRSLTQQENNDE